MINQVRGYKSIIWQYKTAFTKTQIYSHIEFTNFKCTSMNKEVADFEYCSLKSVNRTYQYISTRIKVHKLLNSLKVNFGLHQQINGYKPFLYNITFDGCQFIKNTKSNVVAKYFYDFIRNISNLNHSCPYNHDIIMDKLPLTLHSRLQSPPFTNKLMFPTYARNKGRRNRKLRLDEEILLLG
ncbi:GD18263 [Drosophila simulans]|uniref:GD18263 n=1 Tax=Drosophila simulans TaxID=7240 RepID=B4QTT7_DROSI|nr:GD18263 [Drosophila simulans]